MAGLIKIVNDKGERKAEFANRLSPLDYHIVRAVKEAFRRLRKKKLGIKEINQGNIEKLCREITAIPSLKAKRGKRIIYEFSVTDIAAGEVLAVLLYLAKKDPETYALHFLFFRKSRRK